MPRKRKSLAARGRQDGVKICGFCHTGKDPTDFYISMSPLFSVDGRAPICKECVLKSSLNDDGSINEAALNRTLKMIDRPYYRDSLEASVNAFRKANPYIEDGAVRFYGREILRKYFRIIAMPQDKNKLYEDSEKTGFRHRAPGGRMTERERIEEKYGEIMRGLPAAQDDALAIGDGQWTDRDRQNMRYVISTIGYDPYADMGLSDMDRKYCYNILAGYCDTEGILEDGHKMQGVIEIAMLYCQCKKVSEAMNTELSLPDVDYQNVQKLTQSKSSLLSSIATIARDNNISSNYSKAHGKGESTLTLKMREMEEIGYEGIEVNLFDIKTSEAFRQIDEISNSNIASQLTLDDSEYGEIVRDQRETIQAYCSEVEQLREENRILRNRVMDLEAGQAAPAGEESGDGDTGAGDGQGAEPEEA